MQRPPPGVKLVIEAVCIMKGIKPKKVPGEKPGSKVDDYWEPGKGLLQDPGRFLESLFKFEKVTMLSPWANQWVGHSRMGHGEVPSYQCLQVPVPPPVAANMPHGEHRTCPKDLGDDSTPLPNRCLLRKLGPGQAPVPVGRHPRSL